MNKGPVITVCTTCGDPGVAERAGAALLRLLEDALAHCPDRDRLQVRGTECMSGCDRPCAVSFIGAGKYSYLFGDLTPDADAVAAILACADLYRSQEDGLMAWKARPEPLRRGIIARIPPLPR